MGIYIMTYSRPLLRATCEVILLDPSSTHLQEKIEFTGLEPWALGPLILFFILWQWLELTENFNGDEIGLSLSNLVHSQARDVGLGLERDRTGVNVINVRKYVLR